MPDWSCLGALQDAEQAGAQTTLGLTGLLSARSALSWPQIPKWLCDGLQGTQYTDACFCPTSIASGLTHARHADVLNRFKSGVPCRTPSLWTHAPGRPPRVRLRSHPFRRLGSHLFRQGHQGGSVVGAVCLLQGPSRAALLSKQGSAASVWSPRQVSWCPLLHALAPEACVCRSDTLSPASAYAPTVCWSASDRLCLSRCLNMQDTPAGESMQLCPSSATMTSSTSLSECVRARKC